ncbi:hypothetical protein Dimus_038214 [Dionaea muscipula]
MEKAKLIFNPKTPSSVMAGERNATRQSKVDASAVHITEATSILTAGDVEDFNDAFPLPADYQYVVPQPGNTVVDIELANTVAIHFESLRGGLRLPLHPFIRSILKLHNLLPGQLTPNTYSLIVAYIIRCGMLGASSKYGRVLLDVPTYPAQGEQGGVGVLLF